MVQIQMYKGVTNPETGYLESVPAEVIEMAEKDLPSLKSMGLASSYSYIPVTGRDIVNGAAVEMMSEPLFAGITKTIGAAATYGGGMATLLGLGLNFGTDAWYILKNYYQAKNPEKFWDDYFSDLKEANQDEGKSGNFAKGTIAGQSSTLGGSAAELANQSNSLMFNAGYIVGKIGSVIGLNVGLTKSVAGLTGLVDPKKWTTASFVASNGLSTGLDEMSQKMGMGYDTTAALGSGLAMTTASWATGSLFMSALPYAGKALLNGVKGSSVGMPVYTWDRAVAAGIQNAAWDVSERWMFNSLPHDTPDIEVLNPVSIASSIGLGMAFSAMFHGRSGKNTIGLSSDKNISEDVDNKILNPIQNISDVNISKNTPEQITRLIESEVNTTKFTSEIGKGRDQILTEMLSKNNMYSEKNMELAYSAFDKYFPNYNAMLTPSTQAPTVKLKLTNEEINKIPESINNKKIGTNTAKFKIMAKNFNGTYDEFISIIDRASKESKGSDIPNHIIEKLISGR